MTQFDLEDPFALGPVLVCGPPSAGEALVAGDHEAVGAPEVGGVVHAGVAGAGVHGAAVAAEQVREKKQNEQGMHFENTGNWKDSANQFYY